MELSSSVDVLGVVIVADAATPQLLNQFAPF